MRKVLFKTWISAIWIDGHGGEHETYSSAQKEVPNLLAKQKEGTGAWTDFANEGLFHQWGIAGDADGMNTVGIIEIPGGEIRLALPQNVKFVK